MTTRDERTWTIAEVAEDFDVTLRTIRHYEDVADSGRIMVLRPNAAAPPGSSASATGSGWR